MKKILILLLMIFCVSLSCTACKYLISHGEVKDEAKVIMPDDMQKIESIINDKPDDVDKDEQALYDSLESLLEIIR